MIGTRSAVLLMVAFAITGCAGGQPLASASAAAAPSASVPSADATPEIPEARPSPSTVPFASGEAVTHTSQRFGYTLRLPAGWTYYSPATEDWPPAVYPTSASRFTDKFDRRPGPFPAIDISTQRLPDDMTPEAFLAWLDVENAKICTVETTEDVTVDGATGRLQRQTCGYNAWEVAVFDGDRVYLVYWLGEPSRLVEERPLFDAFISTFRFAP